MVHLGDENVSSNSRERGVGVFAVLFEQVEEDSFGFFEDFGVVFDDKRFIGVTISVLDVGSGFGFRNRSLIEVVKVIIEEEVHKVLEELIGA